MMIRTGVQRRLFSVSSQVLKTKKKIEVQLLKDFEGLGKKGEIVKVLPSKMINYLHPNNGAAYILPGQQPRIPVVEKEVPVLTTETIAKKVIQTVDKPDSENVDKPVSKADLFKGFLFDVKEDASEVSNQSKPAEDESYFKSEAFRELPSTLTFERSTNNSGALSKPITKEEFASILESYTDKAFKPEEISFYHIDKDSKIKVEELDYAALYETVVSVKGSSPVTKSIFIDSTTILRDNLPERPL